MGSIKCVYVYGLMTAAPIVQFIWIVMNAILESHMIEWIQ